MPPTADEDPSSPSGSLGSDVLVAAGLLLANGGLDDQITVDTASDRLRELLSPAALWVSEPLSPEQASKPSYERLGGVPRWQSPTLDPLDRVVAIVRGAWAAVLPPPRASWGSPVLRLEVHDPADARRLCDMNSVGAHLLSPCIWQRVPHRFSWRWPLRIGIAGGPRSQDWLDELERSPHASLYDARLIAAGDEEPIDICLVDAESAAAPAMATCVILMSESSSPEELVARGSAEFRAAIVAGVVSSDVSWFDRAVVEMAHDQPIDVAMRLAAPSSLIAADAHLLPWTAVRQWALEMEDQIREHETGARDFVPEKDHLHALVLTSDFDAERHGATGIVDVIRSMVGAGFRMALDRQFAMASAKPQPKRPTAARRLIADARTAGRYRRKTLMPDADHELLVRIAIPGKCDTAAQVDFPEGELPPNESVELMVHATSAAVGLFASVPVVLSTADHAAPSTTALFTFRTKGEGTVVDIKVLVTHRERPLQESHYVATVRSRSVPGDRVQLTAVALSSWPEPREKTTAAQRSLEVNGANLVRSGVNLAVDLSQLRPLLDEIEGEASRVLASDDAPETLDAATATKLLVSLARRGADLKSLLIPLDIGDATTVSLLVDATTPVLPLELAYDAPTPAENAKLCEHRPGGTMTDRAEVCADAGEHVVCPFAFWGQRRVIARTIRLASTPARRVETAPLTLRPVLYAATTHADEDVQGGVKPSDFLATELVHMLGADDVTRVTSWGEWKRAVKKSHPQLLVVLGHTESAGLETMLEIGDGSFLRSPDIRPEFLLSEHSPPPLVILLACSTAVPRNCFGGLPAAFTGRGAAAVVATLTKMHGPHGARAAAAVVRAIRENCSGDGSTLGSAMTEARRQLIREGLLVGLLLVSHGEIDVALTQ